MKLFRSFIIEGMVLAFLFAATLSGAIELFGQENLKTNPPEADRPQHTNRLVKEKSPYLLQHAHNPVDWYPWGEDAFAKARRENKPIFLSVGYSTCHWCHVMEHESFENLGVARVLNEGFVCIKVDREERPDVDRVYMTFVQATTGGGGWPMSVWLTPERKPFFGGTYFPPETFTNLLERISTVWETDREKVIAQGDELTRALQKQGAAEQSKTNALEKAMLQNAFREIAVAFDPKEGGEAGAPKFPRPVTMNFLFRVMAREGKKSGKGKQALEMNLLTLRKMAAGGIHDHLGGGFHRYSVDEFWHVPHFEKMLYDQAQLAISYLDAFQISRTPLYEKVARSICDYVRRDMTDKQGGFYSAEDADSLFAKGKPEHGEGAFYIWKKDEIDRVLGKPTSDIFSYHYGVEDKGNVQKGSDPRGELRDYNVLIERHSFEETAKHFQLKEDQLQKTLTESRKKLFEARGRRPRPSLDDKIITSWNGLMISAFSKAYQLLEDPAYLESATRAARFVREQLYDPGTGELSRSYRQGASEVRGFADDYAFLIQGLLDLYEASFDVQWLKWALQLQATQNRLFRDKEAGGYFSVSGTDPTILLRMKEDYDGAEPSANSVSALNLLRLAQMTGDATLRQEAERIFQAFSRKLMEIPRAAPQMLVALDFHFDKPKQIMLAGQRDSPQTRTMLSEVHRHFSPNKILMLVDGGANQEFLAEKLEFIKSVQRINGATTVYICENYVCKLPTADPAKVAQLLSD